MAAKQKGRGFGRGVANPVVFPVARECFGRRDRFRGRFLRLISGTDPTLSKAHGHNQRPNIRAVPFGTVLALAIAFLVGGACNRSRAAQQNAVVDRGAGQYAKLCATCHGPTGNGYISDNAPSLKTKTFLSTVTDDFLRVAILRGRPGTAMGAYGRDTGGPLGTDDANAIIAARSARRPEWPRPWRRPRPGRRPSAAPG